MGRGETQPGAVKDCVRVQQTAIRRLLFEVLTSHISMKQQLEAQSYRVLSRSVVVVNSFS
jgi:hypothetical protein